MGIATTFQWDALPPYGDDKADRRIIEGGAGDFKRVMVAAGTVAARHAHEFEQFFMVASGRGTLTWEGGEIALAPGLVIHFDPHVWHEAVFDTDSVLFEVNFRP